MDEVLALARDAERAGVDGLWVGDSLFARPRLDPLTTLAALATATTRCVLGTAVLVAPMWNPLLLARQVATIDHLAGGRLVLGFGAGPGHGPARKEFAALGLPFEGRLTRTLEVLEICRALWSGAPSTHTGPLWCYRNVSLLPPTTAPSGPAVLLGGAGPRTLQAAGASFDGWLPVATSIEEFQRGHRHVAAAAAATGRAEPTVLAYLSVAVDADVERARRTARTSLEAYYGAPWAVIGDLQEVAAGPPHEVARVVARYTDAGASQVIVRVCGSNVMEQLDALVTALA